VNYQLDGNYQFKEAFQYILLTTPETTYEYMPFIIMIGCLFALGNLSNNSELTILRAAGMSITAIVRPVFINVGALLLVVIFINETMTPTWSHNADVLKQLSAAKGGATRYGEWKKEQSSFLYLGAADQNQLDNVQSFTFDGNQLIRTENIEQLMFDDRQLNWQVQSESQLWQFNDGRWLNKGDIFDPSYGFTPGILQANQLRSGLLSLSELWQLMSYSKDQQINNTEFATAFYTKLFMPIITLALVWVSSIFVFGSTRKTAIGARIFIGVLVGVVLKLLQNLLTPMIINFSVSPLLVGVVPLIVIVAFGVFLQRRTR